MDWASVFSPSDRFWLFPCRLQNTGKEQRDERWQALHVGRSRLPQSKKLWGGVPLEEPQEGACWLSWFLMGCCRLGRSCEPVTGGKRKFHGGLAEPAVLIWFPCLGLVKKASLKPGT